MERNLERFSKTWKGRKFHLRLRNPGFRRKNVLEGPQQSWSSTKGKKRWWERNEKSTRDDASRHMPRARNREVLQDWGDAQATIERIWSSMESLLLRVRISRAVRCRNRTRGVQRLKVAAAREGALRLLDSPPNLSKQQQTTEIPSGLPSNLVMNPCRRTWENVDHLLIDLRTVKNKSFLFPARFQINAKKERKNREIRKKGSWRNGWKLSNSPGHRFSSGITSFYMIIH